MCKLYVLISIFIIKYEGDPTDLDVFSLSERGAGVAGSATVGAALDDAAPLFYSPGKRGYYSPRQGRATPERINAFRNVGR